MFTWHATKKKSKYDALCLFGRLCEDWWHYKFCQVQEYFSPKPGGLRQDFKAWLLIETKISQKYCERTHDAFPNRFKCRTDHVHHLTLVLNNYEYICLSEPHYTSKQLTSQYVPSKRIWTMTVKVRIAEDLEDLSCSSHLLPKRAENQEHHSNLNDN